jgi:succinate dehydrogenase subunit C
MSPRPYMRSMRGWWRRDPFFMRYMLREATAVAVLVYAVILTLGVVRLAEGENAWNAWLAALRSPWAVLLHLVLFGAMVFHALSWFEIMPKTLPTILIAGRRVSGATITVSGWTATVLASVTLLALALWWPS